MDGGSFSRKFEEEERHEQDAPSAQMGDPGGGVCPRMHAARIGERLGADRDGAPGSGHSVADPE